MEKIKNEIEDELGFDLDWNRKEGVSHTLPSKGISTSEMKTNGPKQSHGI